MTDADLRALTERLRVAAGRAHKHGAAELTADAIADLFAPRQRPDRAARKRRRAVRAARRANR